MVYERTLKSERELLDELQGLEVDAGVRASATFDGKPSLLFVTKHSGGYSVWIRSGRRGGPDQGTFRTFRGFQDLRGFLEGVLDKPLRAHIY